MTTPKAKTKATTKTTRATPARRTPKATPAKAPAAPANKKFTVEFGASEKHAFFANTKTTTLGTNKADRAAQHDRLSGLTMTEVALLEEAAKASGYPVSEIIRLGAIERAKRIYVASKFTAVSGQGVTGSKDEIHRKTYDEMAADLQKRGLPVNITPTMLSYRAKSNARSARRWLDLNGKTYTVQQRRIRPGKG